MTTHTNSTHPSNSVIWHLNPLATSDHLITIELHYSPRVFCMTYSLTTPYLQPEHHGKLPQTARISKLEKGMKPKSTVPEKVLKIDQIRPYSHIIFKLSSKKTVLKIGQIGHYSHRQSSNLIPSFGCFPRQVHRTFFPSQDNGNHYSGHSWPHSTHMGSLAFWWRLERVESVLAQQTKWTWHAYLWCRRLEIYVLAHD